MLKVIHSLLLISVYAVVLELFQSSYAFTQTTYPSSITRCASTLVEESDTSFSTPFNDKTKPIEQIPHEQRISNTRKARRLNHPFQHLYRNSDPSFEDDDWNDAISITEEIYDCYKSIFDIDDIDISQEQFNSTFAQTPMDIQTSLLAIQYLNIHGGYSFQEIESMHARFPPLLEIDVIRHLRPKMRFLKDCLGGIASTDDQVLNSQVKDILPASFFGARLERTIAPRHAFLVHVGLPSGKALWDGTYQQNNSRKGSAQSLLEQFLLGHRKPKQFAAMCNNWKSLYGSNYNLPITAEQIIAFDKLFQRGILSAARDDIQLGNNGNSPSLLQTANVTSAQLVKYLIEHGANPYETDVRGASLFHWCAGSGNLDGLKELVDGCDRLDLRIQARRGANDNNTGPSNPGVHAALLWKASRDDATPFHWAAAGAGPKEFGIGGNIDVCNYLLELCKEYPIISQRKLIDCLTKDNNSILMWAAWSRSLDIVKLLVRNRADTSTPNRNGCTVAHWACSGGDLSICQYLHKMANVDFTVENYQGNTPLSHSVAYARYDIAKWLKEDLKVEDTGNNAQRLATDFISWADEGLGLISEEEETKRRSVYSLFNSFNDWKNELEDNIE